MSLVNTETGGEVEAWPDWWLSDAPLTRHEAEQITAQITGYVGVTWRLIAIAHDRGAHRALGFATFAEYLRDRFDVSKSQGYRLIQHARVMELLGESAGVVDVSPMGDIPERQTRAINAEAVAAEIAATVPEDATEQDRVDLVKRTVTEHYQTATETRPSDAEPAQPRTGSADEGGADMSSPPPDPKPAGGSPPFPPAGSDDLATYLIAALKAEKQARGGLLSFDPERLVLTSRDHDLWGELAADLRRFADDLDAARAATRPLRSVK